MGEGSAIAWTDHTFNPWWGCVKVSPACTNCYAATFDHRLGGDHWGPRSERKFFGDKHWNEPRRWNKAAEKAGKRMRVFCASMADVFEDRPEIVEHRARLFALIAETPWLDWLLLTKRPENLAKMLPPVRTANIWLGTTVENQEYADVRIPLLLAAPAAVHFLSVEPQLGQIDVTNWLHVRPMSKHRAPIDWVIAGCESGHGARPQNVDWFRSLRDQCASAGVAFFLKQATEELSHSTSCAVHAIAAGEGSWRKAGGVIKLPYLDGVQYAAFPEVRR